MTTETDAMRSGVMKPFSFPDDVVTILRQRQLLKNKLLEQTNLIAKRVAILGGSTTTEVRKLLELFLLGHGIQPSFYESGYNRYREDVLFQNPNLWNFGPEIVFIHTNWRNIAECPEPAETEADVERRIRREMERFESVWEKIQSELGAIIIQNNFDLPSLRPLGNLESSEVFGRVNFLFRLNAEFARYARNHSRFFINDILYLSAQVGLTEWTGSSYWYNFHMALSPKATVALARNVAGIAKSIYGKSKKCLILDLDNTLWGGVVGDDGVQNLILGRDHPVGEVFSDFQSYLKNLQRRGVILAVCTKNDPENAIEGFLHPDCILKPDDFSAFKANWNPKPENICEIATELNIGLDSIVFVDDNPAERTLVAEQLLEVAVPDVGSDVSHFAEVLERERYFEVDRVVQDDINRSAHYNSNARRSSVRSGFQDYREFLASLEMTAEIGPFSSTYLQRITQLINKTNQFNLTTRRYTFAEVESISRDSCCISLCGRLVDRFGDNGLVSVLVGRVAEETVQLDLWLMSCRVFDREMELAMFDALIEQCHACRVTKIVGVYIPSNKNSIVAGHYANLGFTRMEEKSEGREFWRYDVPQIHSAKAHFVRRIEMPKA